MREDSCCLPSEGSAGAVQSPLVVELCVCGRQLRMGAWVGEEYGVEVLFAARMRARRDVPLEVVLGFDWFPRSGHSGHCRTSRESSTSHRSPTSPLNTRLAPRPPTSRRS